MNPSDLTEDHLVVISGASHSLELRVRLAEKCCHLQVEGLELGAPVRSSSDCRSDVLLIAAWAGRPI